MNTRINNVSAAIALVAATALFAPPPTLGATATPLSTDPDNQEALVARGEYLVTAVGCSDCHTPWVMGAEGPEPDMSRLLSGHPESMQMPAVPELPEGPWMMVAAATNTAWAGPWGVSFTRNLTPDEETGLGEWSLKDFVDTIRTGRRMGRGRMILPPMPIPAYTNFSDEDLEAIYSNLRTIPAISNQVPEPWDPPMSTVQLTK